MFIFYFILLFWSYSSHCARSFDGVYTANWTARVEERTPGSDRNRRGLNLHLRLTHRQPCPATSTPRFPRLFIHGGRTDTRHTTRGPRGVRNPTSKASNRPRSSADAHMHNLCGEFRPRSCTLSYEYPDSSRRKYERCLVTVLPVRRVSSRNAFRGLRTIRTISTKGKWR